MTKDKNQTKVEFAVKVKGQECVDKVISKIISDAAIPKNKISSVIDMGEARIVLETNQPWIDIHEIIEKTGFESALVGFSGNQSAVSILDKGSTPSFKGVIRFCNNNEGIIIDGVIDGLKEQKTHKLSIYEYGDLSDGCNNLGEVYRKSNYSIFANELGRAIIRTSDKNFSISELIGRGVCVSDDSTGEKLGCGIISRSAGIFQNYKRICLCSGKLLWDERDLPNIVRK